MANKAARRCPAAERKLAVATREPVDNTSGRAYCRDQPLEGADDLTRVAERSERITDMFLRLAEDPALLSEFARDPRVALEASGLTDTQVATVLTGDADTV